MTNARNITFERQSGNARILMWDREINGQRLTFTATKRNRAVTYRVYREGQREAFRTLHHALRAPAVVLQEG
jgi:hypothetical protein